MSEQKNSIMTLADFEITEMTPETRSALDLHSNIIIAEQNAAAAMLSLCENLKKMRDLHLYKSLGFDKFEDYTEQACNIKKRQAYNYIQTYERLGGQFMQSNAQLGITKLQLLTEVCGVDRDEFVENNDLDGMSVAEVKKLIEENNQRGEQLSLLAEQLENNKNNSAQVIENQQETISQLKAENEELRSRPVEVAVQEPSAEDIEKAANEKIASLKADFEAEKKQLEAEAKVKIKEAKEKAVAKAQKNNQKAIDEAVAVERQKAKAEYQAQIDSAEAEKAEALKQAKEMASKLDKNADADLVTASVYFGEVQKSLNAFLQSTAKVESSDAEKGKKLKKLAADFLSKIITQFNN
jgi:hypothetical protein